MKKRKLLLALLFVVCFFVGSKADAAVMKDVYLDCGTGFVGIYIDIEYNEHDPESFRENYLAHLEAYCDVY
ncbi:hypothetical protein OAT16_10670 [Prolixibacteraceae bacterium]|nr:hypothetical protein [Prolixibacteraceae bacterium]